MLKKLLLLAATTLLLSSCLADKKGPKVVILKHPDTLDFQNCEVKGEWPDDEAFAANEKCVQALEKQGYTVWGSR
ncbi:hypothetical protein [Desulfopila aestuarii]|uniref:Uncharacterized protein n=1 Tax=Desulfopila aestuarii DSM 18488 TaxID=1121416 RepID=A0A1M7Y8V0_9BACT|nr:hypothetical protein [Desulfopila aestuarii]SHO49064.1 hypothetical protein SAMN02745220_02666 [Desulfopila aestuarii DSM 18488]